MVTQLQRHSKTYYLLKFEISNTGYLKVHNGGRRHILISNLQNIRNRFTYRDEFK